MLTLLDDTLRLATETQMGIAELAKEAEVGQRWLRKFLAGEIRDPSVRRVQRLHDVLIAEADTDDRDQAPACDGERKAA